MSEKRGADSPGSSVGVASSTSMESAPAQVSQDSAKQWLHKALALPDGDMPFPWQGDLFTRFAKGTIERSLDIPTGLGKTAVMAIWLVARAHGAALVGGAAGRGGPTGLARHQRRGSGREDGARTNMSRDERLRVLKAIARIAELDLGAIGRWDLDRQTLEANLQGLLPGTWTGPARNWATVTPMAFDTDPGDPFGAAATEGVALACTRLGLPEPLQVVLAGTPFLHGVEHAREFPLFRATPGGPRRRHVHVRLEFDELVHGPVAIGAARYLGYGLCRPMPYGE